jgi:hypothetical protein
MKLQSKQQLHSQYEWTYLIVQANIYTVNIKTIERVRGEGGLDAPQL